MEKSGCSSNIETKGVSFSYFHFPLRANMCVVEGMKFPFLVGIFGLDRRRINDSRVIFMS